MILVLYINKSSDKLQFSHTTYYIPFSLIAILTLVSILRPLRSCCRFRV